MHKVSAKPNLPTLTHEENSTIDALPDFSVYSQVSKKKQAFFEFLYPMVEAENQHILMLRRYLKSLKTKDTNLWSGEEKDWILSLLDLYKVKSNKIDQQLITSLLIKVDTIPPSLMLAQAAIESGWGSSRFAQHGNNLFGLWCFSQGCGMVPLNRQEGLNHEVLKFESVNQSVRTYIRHLNSFKAYQEFRELRHNSMLKQLNPKVYTLAEGLKQYSQQGVVYVAKITQMIRQNNLEQYDLRYTKALNNMLK